MRFISWAVVAFMFAIPVPTPAQESSSYAWPQRPVTIVVPFQAGGSADLLARILQQRMQADRSAAIWIDSD